MYFRSLKRRTETCVEGEVKGEAGHKWGPPRLRFDVLGFAAYPRLRVYPYSVAPEFGFSTLWLVKTPEMGENSTQHAVFMIPACCPQTWEHVGVMACAVKMLDMGGIGAGQPQLGRLKKC
jgi:hypothetical protein